MLDPVTQETSLPLFAPGDLARLAAPDWSRGVGLREAAKETAPIRVVDPVARASGLRGKTLNGFQEAREGRYGPDALHMAHQTESLVVQVTNKFTDLISKEGFSFSCKDKSAHEYLETRLLYLGRCTGISFRALLKETARDFVGYGNAYWAKVYDKKQALTVGGRRLRAAIEFHRDENRGVIIGFFRIDPRTLIPRYAQNTGRHNGWIQKAVNKPDKTFRLDEVVHFAYQRPAGEVLGVSLHRPVIDDIRTARDMEEYAFKLMEKMLFPITQHIIPAKGDDQYGLAEDVDQAAYSHQSVAPDGVIVTPFGHEIKMIGAAGEALDPVPMLEYMLRRLYMGEGVSGTIMGTEDSSAGTSDVLTTQIHDRVKSFQQDIEEVVNLHVFPELLLEAGYSATCASLVYAEIEHEARIRLENHAANMYTNGLWTETEARAVSDKNPVTATERKNLHLTTSQIPLIKAETDIATDAAKEQADHLHVQNKDLATHTHKLGKDALAHQHDQLRKTSDHDAAVQKDLVASGVSPSAKQQVQLAKTQAQISSAPAKTAKPTVRRSSSSNARQQSGARGAVASANNPSNQHGSRGAARASATPAAGHASQRKAKSSSVPPSVKGA